LGRGFHFADEDDVVAQYDLIDQRRPDLTDEKVATVAELQDRREVA
jgi:hypothetical protein